MREQEPRAAALLSLMAMLDPQAIPEMLLRQEDGREVDFFSAVGTLDSFSLSRKAIGKETYAIHRLVQLSIHVWLEQHNEKTQSYSPRDSRCCRGTQTFPIYWSGEV
jgi:hypothetical protein